MQNLNFPNDLVNKRSGGKKGIAFLRATVKKIKHVHLGYNGV